MKSTDGLYFLKLDQVRAFAMFVVFYWHMSHVFVATSHVPTFFAFSLFEEGHAGVGLFMALSGYLFATITAGRQIAYAAFLWNRFIRLAPLLLVVLIFAKFYDGLPWSTLPMGLIDPRNWSYGAWSIAVELHFYALFPIIVIAARRIGLAALAVLIVSAIAARLVIWWSTGEVQVLAYWTIIGRLDAFLWGMIAANLSRKPWFLENAGKIGLLSGLSGLIYYHVFNVGGGFYHMPAYPSPSPLWVFHTTLEGLFFAFAIAGYHRSKVAADNVVGRMIAKVGEASYSIYLIHLIIIFNLVRPFKPDLSDPVLVAGLTVAVFPLFVAVGWVSYAAIERPFLRLRRPYLTQPTPT